MDIRLDPDVRVMEHRFFRNFFGYLEDCRKAKMEPNPCQLLLFLFHVDGPLSICPVGPELFANYVDFFLALFLGVIVGQWLFGFKETYPEYYRERTE